MILPYSTDIRDIDSIGDDSHIKVTLADVVDYLPIDSNLKAELSGISQTFKEASLHVFTEPSEDAEFEGRGRYSHHVYGDKDIVLYTKGVGNMPNLIQATEEGLSDELYSFGPDYYGKYLFDGISSPSFPRILGADYFPNTSHEFLNALRVMVNICSKHKFTYLSDLIDNGVSIPISTAYFGGLTDYIGEKVYDELDGRWDWKKSSGLGAVTLLVPSTKRTNIRIGNKVDSHILSSHIARGIKSLYSTSNAVFAFDSCHAQNFYLAPKSICPISDFSDLIFGLDPEKKTGLLTLGIIRLMSVCSSNYGISSDQQILGHTVFMNGLIEKEIEYVPDFYTSSLTGLIKHIAECMKGEQSNDFFIPSDEVISKIIDSSLYMGVEAKMLLEGLNIIEDSGVLEIKAKLPEMPA
ncbi:MAG: hypothetical protein GQ477_02805 [Nanohaloarchaea archaeon]|nr:hypothetical protein [Candidatus Nanohaloarchaea archaeon]